MPSRNPTPGLVPYLSEHRSSGHHSSASAFVHYAVAPTCRLMSLLPLFTGVTTGMEFSEICRFGVFLSPAYVRRWCTSTQTANATRKAGAHHDYRVGVVCGHPALPRLASSPAMLTPEVAPACPSWPWLGSCSRSSPCWRCFCAPWSPARICSRSLPCSPRWCFNW